MLNEIKGVDPTGSGEKSSLDGGAYNRINDYGSVTIRLPRTETSRAKAIKVR